MVKRQKRFEQIDHTADVGLKVYGESLKEFFENAALGLFDIICDVSRVTATNERKVEVEGADREALLVNWLSELNYLFLTGNELYNEFQIDEMSDTKLSAVIKGEELDLDKHEIYTEVKAVTYHALSVDETATGWQAQIIFDL